MSERIYCYPDEVALKWKAERDELLEALKSARGWVSTHVMQTYSRVAADEVQQIDELIARVEKE